MWNSALYVCCSSMPFNFPLISCPAFLSSLRRCDVKLKAIAVVKTAGWGERQCALQSHTSPAFEVAANCQDDAEDQQDNDAKGDELYLHVLPPHLLPYLCSLLLEILCLQANINGSTSPCLMHWGWWQRNEKIESRWVWEYDTCERRSSVLSTSSSIFSPRSSTWCTSGWVTGCKEKSKHAEASEMPR